jgi:hypothetical protein
MSSVSSPDASPLDGKSPYTSRRVMTQRTGGGVVGVVGVGVGVVAVVVFGFTVGGGVYKVGGGCVTD